MNKTLLITLVVLLISLPMALAGYKRQPAYIKTGPLDGSMYSCNELRVKRLSSSAADILAYKQNYKRLCGWRDVYDRKVDAELLLKGN